jgi:SAM-dependent methyltransferase
MSNEEQHRSWNEDVGQRWVALQEIIDAQLEPFSAAVIERLDLRAADRVLDIGCGCGASTLALARRVTPAGFVMGFDLSARMLGRARERVRAEHMSHVTLEAGDAQTHAFPKGDFDALFSRFGVMFFDEPASAFANLRLALRPAGKLGFVCWQPLERSPWFEVPLRAVSRHVDLKPSPPGAPGPFAFQDAARVRAILGEAGFTGVAIEPFEITVPVRAGGSVEEAIDFLLQLGPAGRALREAPPEAQPAAARSLAEALAPFVTPNGVELDAAAWIVTAKNSA